MGLSSAYINPDKILRRPDQILKLKEGQIPSVLNVEVDLSEQCNANCLGCDSPRHFNSFMSTEIVRETVERLKSWGTEAVVLTGGGEPTLHPHWQSIANDWAHEFKLGLYTNGIKLDLAPCEEAFQWVFVSLDAPDAESWAEYKRVDPSLFRKVLANIEAASYYTTVGVGFLVGEDNYRRVDEMALVGIATHATYIHFRPRFPVTHSDWETDARPRLEQVARLPRVSVAWDKFEDAWHWRRSYALCWASMFVRQIDAEGNVYSCPTLRWSRKIGHVSNFTPLSRPLPVLPCCRELCRGHSTNKILSYVMDHGPHDVFV